MKFTLTVAALIGTIALTNVYAAESKTEAKTPMPMSTGAVSTDELRAEVKEIDYKTRKVTLRQANGEEFSFVAGENVKRLDQVKKGDIITAKYVEALVFDIKKGGHTQAMEESTSIQRAQEGNKPSGVMQQQVTATVMVSAIDKTTPSVTFKNADGKVRTLKVKDPQRLDGVKVGDTIEVTYMEALAMKVEKAGTKL
jgi:Cu/Ag efflux protein CusF